MHEIPQLKCDDKIMDLGPEVSFFLFFVFYFERGENYLYSWVKINFPSYHLIFLV
jgi:hypothetical protein